MLRNTSGISLNLIVAENYVLVPFEKCVWIVGLNYFLGKIRICETHPADDPHGYPLIFPGRNDCYHVDIRGKEGVKKVTATELYTFHLHPRPAEFF